MNRISRWLALVASRQDIALAVLLLVAVFMMIVPLPTGLVDLMIAFNLMIAIILLMMSLYIRDPLEFAAFPSVLLITTLYRLALTISTTRLILLQADAGEIVYTFGSFAVGGNLGVGLIVFVIITIVQFIVITKGSERVAEVGARFSLDGMPGKQMSIDGDMRAGIIDANEARRQRGLVQKESQLYGAMDGAMKFVKGDAIAGIIIILVNILGGTAVGVFMHGMSASEAMSTYAILSIGDGLIGQIPALLISITAGIIVTRVPGEVRQSLAADLTEQIGRQPQALWLAGAVLLVFAVLPGFPVAYFLALAALMLGGAWLLKRRGRRAGTAGAAHAANGAAPGAANGAGPADTAMTPGAVPLMIRFAESAARADKLADALEALRWRTFEQLGLPLPDIHLQAAADLDADTVEVLLYQEPVLALSVPRDLLLADARGAGVAHSERVDTLPFGKLRLHWIAPGQADTLAALGIVLHRDEARIAHCLSLVVERFANQFVGVQETRFLMDAMEARYAELVKEVQRQMPIGRIADVLQRLVEEGISVRDLRSIFEALIEWAPREKDPVMLVEYVRIALRRHIGARYRAGQAWISGWMIGDRIEAMVRESIRQTAAGSYSSLGAESSRAILGQIRAALADADLRRVVLLTAVDVRRFIRKMVEREFGGLAVLSFQEIGDEAELRVIGTIDLIGEPADALA
ncbi:MULTISPECIES: EscV/YscV/HrcV family type III secretion system export apparatus protein [Burkholderia]|uniref:EscV/YscV/HrcV family type III secretion system export apparatus protein n=1 Tax=Burkholderia TaxID=32008 RepID=UPI0003281114|nr:MULTISPECIES: EscV/YscV/HrcV family type III secretion system export apparatus protein [Burkholderia]AGK46770.1 type III secretion, HrcV family protein [Burkholderia thailandensis MSMB121]ATF36956.1 EscV/YscV/HrcV family type III secretion system export apparatus protein [Burkholderia thailandensis]KST74329.1 secretion system apparatus protein SsaV [Burkholderia humptydooensis]KVN03485.1 secretion system apparatus protein SsaV [Burkholderia sp. MSMB1552]KWZ55917.1 secretion system apparatus